MVLLGCVLLNFEANHAQKNLRQIGWVIGLGFMEIITGFGRVQIGFDRVKPAQSGLLCGS
jgi:hypothetical protein